MLKNMTIKQAQREVKKFMETQGKDWTQTDNHLYPNAEHGRGNSRSHRVLE